jgi:hypothetical protein
MLKNRNMMLGAGAAVVVVIVVALALVLLGGGDDDDADAGSSTVPALTQSITYEGTGLTLNYPDGYVAASDDSSEVLWIAINQETLDIALSDAIFDDGLQAGQFAISSTVLATDEVFENLSLTGEDLDPAIVLAALLTEAELDALVSGVEPITLGDWSGATTSGTYVPEDETLDITIVFLDAGVSYILIGGIAPVGEIGQYDALIRAIAASLEYTAPS